MDSIKIYWRTWLWRDMLTKIITVNVIVWLMIAAVSLFMPDAVAVLALPGHVMSLLHKPWTIVTYMAVHSGFLHLLVNMMWLLLFGRIVMVYGSPRRLLCIYLLGGMAGGCGFVVWNVVMGSSHAMILGASCAVLAVVGAATAMFPQMRVSLMLFGSVRILWVAIAAGVFFILLAPSSDECVAHAAGALVGIAFHRCKFDFVRRSPVRSVNTSGPLSPREHAMLDSLLAKVSRSGYASLSATERQNLFDLSRRARP